MTGETPHGAEAPPPAKEPPPGLPSRAARPPVIRLRRPVVQGIVITGALLVSGALAWAFVIQPDLREQARQRAAETRGDQEPGIVRPSEAVTGQPASYDALPEPRTLRPDPASDSVADTDRAGAIRNAPQSVWRPAAGPERTGPRPGELAARSSLFFVQAVTGGPDATVPAGRTAADAGGLRDTGGVYNPNRLTAPLSPYELKAGTVVPGALLTGIDTSRPGPVVATVTQNVFDSISGRHLLVPQGTRLIGRHEGESAWGDRRAFLVWDRMILPDGRSMILGGEPGVDGQGATGVRGEVDRRLFPLLASTLFAGAITTLGQIAREGDERASRSLLGDAGDAAAIEGARAGGRLVDRELEVSPSIRLRPGAPVRVLVTRDLIMEPYRS